MRAHYSDSDDDPSLISAIRAGDERAASILWRRHSPMVLRMLRRSLGGTPDLEDLAQDVFLAVFDKLGVLREPRGLKAFIITVTNVTCLRERRRLWRRRRMAPLHVALPDVDLVSRHADARIAMARFRYVLGRVRSADRDATALRLVETRELSDIAAALNLSLATVKRRVARGCAHIARLIERDRFLAQYRSALATSDRSPTGTGVARRSQLLRGSLDPLS